ncbi:glycine cleavage system protein H [Pseudoxanthomonas broegbernensis]|uniref:Glycine cleavage system H protein n=1 Tax=Pseudoxanthomonas broegbernensis TaxID=83619 RepID=A0A7V8GKN2_9GAMM|nr:glycine cleavage system protein GcvH [Pseudoxanthomonas broegbernensis]KAF1685097.1 glycine cleavage system protein H [Pseudoxanthomonas broegbernensis]MBB6066240.1 glycine cleavage system H protein [Pseudoxanthomonas broegbernensis]
MSELHYTREHEWLRLEDDGLLTVGITPYAAQALGDVVYVQLPGPGRYAHGAEVAVVESVKAAGNVLMPLDGEVVEVNAALDGRPGLLNEDALGEGWCFRIRADDAGPWASLLDAAAYARMLQGLGA